jgi:hypothetical protein
MRRRGVRTKHLILAASGALAVAGLLLGVHGARAEVASDEAAAILVFPKIVVDISVPQIAPPNQIDTLIRVSNTSDEPITMWCFYVNATPLCDNHSGSCVSLPVTCTPLTECLSQCTEIDFTVTITAGQPVAWLASQGAGVCAQSGASQLPCLPLSDARLGWHGQVNNGGTGQITSLIPPVAEDPFIGELKCIAVDLNQVPVSRNELKGEAEIVRSTPGTVDVEGYNAIGIPAIATPKMENNALVIGGNVCADGSKAQAQCASSADCDGASCVSVGEYTGCPNILILDHFFDGAVDPVSLKPIMTDLTLVPCSENFLAQAPVTTTVQFLIFNEFEQRLSTSRHVSCFDERRISNIDSTTTARSIFSAAVMGTLTGQTRIRGVADQHSDHGHALLGVAEEFRQGGGAAAFNLHFQGSRPQSDFIYVP